MNLPDLLRLLAGVLLLVGGAWQYRRRTPVNGSRGSQSGTLLIMVGLVLIVWVLGNLFAQPAAAEMGR